MKHLSAARKTKVMRDSLEKCSVVFDLVSAPVYTFLYSMLHLHLFFFN